MSRKITAQDGAVDKPGESTVEQYDTDAIPEVEITQEDLAAAGDDPESWLTYGGGYENQRFSTADVITPENLSELELEWSYETGSPEDAFTGSPIVVPGDPPIMYQTNSVNHMKAVNARTGDILWEHRYEPRAEITTPPADRGLAVHGDRIYRFTLDLGVLAVDRYTGEEQWYYNGAAEYRGEEAEDGEYHEELTFPRRTGGSSAFPPTIYEGNILTGSFGGEYGVSGYVRAVDLEGELAWERSTTPEGEWVGDSWKHGGGTSWQAVAVDPQTDTSLWGTANPGPWYGTVRPGWNQYTAGKVAFDATDGEYRWHYQDSPHDWWDYDANSPPFVFDAEIDGEQRRLASWSSKTGWMYTADVETGKLVTRSEEIVDHVNMWALPRQDVEESVWNAPYVWGGTNWQPAAYDPRSNTAVAKIHNRPWKLAWESVEYEAGEGYSGVAGIRFADPDESIPGWNNEMGGHVGVDPVTGEIKWRDWTSEIQWGGALATATGITFTGLTPDVLVALETETGEELWRDEVGVGVAGDPITWYDPGAEKQYVAVQASGHRGTGAEGNRVVAYAVDA